MDAFNSTSSVLSPFGMTPIEKLALQQLVWSAWKDIVMFEQQRRDVQQVATQASAPAWPAEPVLPAPAPPQVPPGISPGRP